MPLQEKIKWKFIGGNLCLDFVNTVGGRYNHHEQGNISFTFKEERLLNFERFVDWGKAKNIINDNEEKNLISFAQKNKREAENIFERARTLRKAIAGIFVKISLGMDPIQRDIDILNHECSIAREGQKLIYTSTGEFVWNSEYRDKPDFIVSQIALSTSELIVSKDMSRIRQCPGDDCGWIFLDKTKNRSRQWCDMKDCGNLAKVHRFREKRKN